MCEPVEKAVGALSTQVKICGLKTVDALEAVIAAGVSHFGMVFFPRSPRNISLDGARRLIQAADGRISSVALVVHANDDVIESIISAVKPDMLQLHGAETAERTAEIRKRTATPVIKAISVGSAGDVERALAYESAADLILFDAKPPADGGTGRPGGNGLAFNWRLLDPIRGRMDFILSGGLTPDNVAEAVRQTGASFVDVSSGVERSPGEKDPALIHRFVKAAEEAALEEPANG